MEVTIIRHRATRRGVIGTLYVDDFECFTMERRSDMLEEGAHVARIAYNGNLMIGDHLVIEQGRREGFDGHIILGLGAEQLVLSETSPAYQAFRRIVSGAKDDPINVEVIDEVDYHEADGDN